MRFNRIASARTSRRRGQVMIIGIVVCVVIMMLMALKLLGPTQNSDGTQGKSVIRQSQDRGDEVQTNMYLGQIRQLIGMYRNDHDGKAPASYEELRHYGKDYPAEMWVNSVDKKPFVYDPATGTIDVDGGQALSRQAQRVDNASRSNNSDPSQAAPPPVGQAPAGQAPAAQPAPPAQVAPGVPDPNSITGKIPQPGGNIPAEDQ